jgi:2-methylcitrate dehydratase PrpD
MRYRLERTTARHEPAFDEPYEDGYNTRLRISLADGTEREAFVDHPSGGVARPLSGAQIVEKFRALVATVVDGERASSIERTVLGLEQLEDADELLTLLGAPVRGQDQSSQGSV